MHAGIRFTGPRTKQMLERSPLVDTYLPFSVPTAPSCSCVLVLEAPLLGKALKERPVPAAMVHVPPLSLAKRGLQGLQVCRLKLQLPLLDVQREGGLGPPCIP